MKGVFLFKSQVFNSQIHPRMLSQCVHAWCAPRFQGIHSQSSGVDLIVSLDIVFNAIPAVNSLLRYTFIKKLYKNLCVKNIRCFHFLFYLSSNVVIIFRTKKIVLYKRVRKGWQLWSNHRRWECTNCIGLRRW